MLMLAARGINGETRSFGGCEIADDGTRKTTGSAVCNLPRIRTSPRLRSLRSPVWTSNDENLKRRGKCALDRGTDGARLTGLPTGDRVYSVISTPFFNRRFRYALNRFWRRGRSPYLSSILPHLRWMIVALSRKELLYRTWEYLKEISVRVEFR